LAKHRRFVMSMVVAVVVMTGAARAQEESAPPGRAPESSEAVVCESVLGGQLWARTELYFGLSRQDAPEISDEEFQGFVDRVVTPRFPDGLTLLTGYGQYRGGSGVVQRETSKVLILFYPLTLRRNRAIENIRARYKEEFDQQAVLRVDDVSCVSF
jgi:hypothetical protein